MKKIFTNEKVKETHRKLRGKWADEEFLWETKNWWTAVFLKNGRQVGRVCGVPIEKFARDLVNKKPEARLISAEAKNLLMRWVDGKNEK